MAYDFPSTPTVGDISNGYIWDGMAWVHSGSSSVPPSTVMRSYLAGLTLSTAGSSATFGIAAGVATDSTNAVSMTLAAAFTKTTGTWVAGSGNGALDTGAIAAAAWYHVFLIRNPTTSAMDVCVSVSLTPGGLPVAAGFTQFRRIGSMKTASSLWVAFTQLGDEFMWVAAVQDATAAAVPTTPTLIALSVPSGVNVGALTRIGINITGAAGFATFHSPSETVTSVGLNISLQTYVANGSTFLAIAAIRTNTAAQIRMIANQAATICYINTYGWNDRRGRDD